MYGQRFETPRARLALIALTVLSIAVLTLLAWAQNGPLKDAYLRNISLVEAVGWWGILPLLPLSVAWRLLAGSVQKCLQIDSPGAWSLLAFLMLLLPLAAYPRSATIDEIVLAPSIPWIIPLLLGWMFRWSPLAVAPRVASMIASFAWGLVGTWGAFGLLLYGGFRGE